MYTDRISIYGFKCFGKAVIEFQFPGKKSSEIRRVPNVNLILGDNGGGKSSVLRAVAIATLAPALLESGFVPYRLVRRVDDVSQKTKCLLKVEGILDENEMKMEKNTASDIKLLARLEIRSRGSKDRLHLDSTPLSPIKQHLFDDYSHVFFIAGYGATRRVEVDDFIPGSARKSRGMRYQRIAGLFEDHVALRPLQSWLKPSNVKNRKYKHAIKILSKLLPGNISFDGKFDADEGQYLFDFEGVSTPFTSLSDGYKAYVGWTGDLIGHLLDVCPEGTEIDEIPGMVLVDEVDLHLHPSWQRTVIYDLAKAFPKIQFIVTSHSPLVVNQVEKENVYITEKAEDGSSTISQLEETVYGIPIDQVLMSSYFGLESTRPKSEQKKSEELINQVMAGSDGAALDYIRQLISPSRDIDDKYSLNSNILEMIDSGGTKTSISTLKKSGKKKTAKRKATKKKISKKKTSKKKASKKKASKKKASKKKASKKKASKKKASKKKASKKRVVSK